MFRSALVALKPAPVQEFLLEFAVSLAARHRLELLGVSVIDEHRLAAPEPVPLGAGAFKAELDLQRLEDARRCAGEATAALVAAAESRGVKVVVEVPDGDTVERLVRRINTVDCLICGHTAGSDAGERSLLNAILKHNPRPAIVVPDSPVRGKNILIAYDGSFQSARAVKEFAHAGMGEGRSVTVVSLHRNIEEARRLAEEATTLLARHGVAAVPHGTVLIDRVASHLLDEVKRVDAGLLVMGAFAHTFMREFLFGSITRTILETLPVPVFLDH